MNEDTVFDQNEVKNQSDKKEKEVKKKGKSAPDKNQQNQEKEGDPKSKKKKITSARVTTAASVAGLAVRLITPLNLFPKSPSEEKDDPISDVITNTNEPEPEIEPEPAPEVSSQLEGHDMTVASEVNDSMSFNEAFAAARQEIGPGGLFVWHGHAYGTYYKNEWDAMSQEDQDQYWADVHHTSEQIHYEEYESDSVSGLDTDQDLGVVIEQKQDGEEEVEAVVEEKQDGEEEVEAVIEEKQDGEEEVEAVVEEEEIQEEDVVEIVEVENEESEVVEAKLDIETNEVAETIEDDDEMEAIVDDDDDNYEPNFTMGTENEDMEESWPSAVDMDEKEDVAYAEIEMMEADDEMAVSDDEMYGHEADFASPHDDFDDFATTSFDSEVEIDDDMDVSDFS